MGNLLVLQATERPKLIYGLLLTIVLATAAQMPGIKVDTDPENMLPDDQPDRVLHDRTKEKFGLWDTIVVGVVNETDPNGVFNPKTLSNLNDLTAKIEQLDGVIRRDLMSISRSDNITQEGVGTIRFEWLMNEAPTTESASTAIRRAVERLPLMQNTLVSEDGRAAGIYVPIRAKSESYRIAEKIQGFIDQLPGNDRYYITGLPVAEDTFGVEMFIQMAVSAPLAALVVYLLLLWFFRSALLVTAPMLMAMATVIITMGLLIGMGYTVHIMSSMIPIFLMPIAVVDSVHLLSEFVDSYRPGDDIKQRIRQTMSHLFKPMLFTTVTSAIGFASLAFTPIPPVQVFGLFVAFGIAVAFLLTITFIPAYMARMNPARLEKLGARRSSVDDRGLLAGLVRGLGRFSLKYTKSLIAVFVLLSGVAVYGIQQIQINDNPVRWFEEQHPIQVADRVLNEHFAGTYNAFLVFEHTPSRDGVDELVKAASNANIPARLVVPLKDETAPPPQRLQNFILALEEAMFDAGEAATEQYEELLAPAELALSNSKYFQQPGALHYIADLQQALQSSGFVGKSNSLADLVKTVYRELQTGIDEDYRIPQTSQGVAETLLSFQSSHRPGDLWHMVTPDMGSAVIWLQLKSGDNQDMSRVVDFVDRYIQSNPLPDGVRMHWSGLAFINVVWQGAMVVGMLGSLASAFIAVLLIMVLLFRSITFGVLAMIPLSLTIAFIYGMIGLADKDYDMPIAILSALTLGLSVDFAIHFLQRLRELVQQHGCWSEAITLMYEEPGRAISRNAIVIALGFLPLLAAPLVPYKTVGFFLATIMAVSCLVTLSLLPAIMHHIHSWLFRRKQDVQDIHV